MPASGGPFPVVLVVQEIFGWRTRTHWTFCRRLAKLSCFAWHAGNAARASGDILKADRLPEILKIVRTVPDAQVMSDPRRHSRFRQKSGKANTAKLAITSFCWGRPHCGCIRYNKDLKANWHFERDWSATRMICIRRTRWTWQKSRARSGSVRRHNQGIESTVDCVLPLPVNQLQPPRFVYMEPTAFYADYRPATARQADDGGCAGRVAQKKQRVISPAE